MKKKLLCVFLSLLTTSTLWAADGDTFTANTVEGVEMTFMVISESEKTCQVGNDGISIPPGTSGAITIPSEVNGYQVKEIGSSAFDNYNNYFSGLTSITIPEGVTSISVYAFYYCSSLTSITIPNSVTNISMGAFYGCSSLTSITIPEGVTSIDKETFVFCQSLTSITIPNSVTSIDWSAFESCSGLTSITIPEGVTSIASRVFANCSSLTSITIPEGVTSIYNDTFLNCTGLTGITIPEGVTSISVDAFYGCNLTNITVESGNTVYDSRDNCNAIINTAYNKLIIGCKNTVIPNSVTSIGSSAFKGCSGLTSITIPEGVTSIGSSAFQDCSNLADISFPNSLKTIENGAFTGTAWYNDLADGVVYIGTLAYEYKGTMPENTVITLKEGTTTIGYQAFYRCTNLASIIFPESMTKIDRYAFYGCSGLTSITIPKGLTNIADDAFSYCRGLTSISVESGNTVYNSRDNCNAILKYNQLILGCKNTVIPASVTSIGQKAFYGCSGLTSIAIPEGVTNIESSVFEGCSGLTSITIPEGVTYIGNGALMCSNLKRVIMLNENPESIDIAPYVYGYPWSISKKEALYVPKGTKDAYTSIWGDWFEKIIELTTLGKNMVSFASEQMLDFSTPIEDLKAYIVSGISSDGKAIINEVKGAVPSGTGLILKGTAGHSYAIPYTTVVPDAVSNMLVGVTEDTEIGGNDLDYILSDGKFVKASYGTLPAGKAYLKLDEALARSVITIGDEITGIKAVDGATIPAERYYNLNGQRVSTPQKGLYIVNGKKVAKK